jgi:hypothetical protein
MHGADLPNGFGGSGDVGGREVDHGEGCAHRATHGRSIDLPLAGLHTAGYVVAFACVCTQRSSWDFIS